MRAKLLLPLAILGLVVAILLLQTPHGYTQQGGKGKQKGGFGGSGKMDPGEIFDKWMSKGKDYAVISEMKMGKQELEAFAKKVGITDDKITRDQYIRFFDMREQIREELKASGQLQPKKGFGGFGPPKDKGQGPVTPDKGPPVGPPAVGTEPPQGKGPPADDGTDRVERQFRGYDRNGDGFLNEEEIQGTRFFKNEWEKWDANKDGKITLEEWRAYMKSREQQQQERDKEKATKTDTALTKPSSSSGVDVILIEEFGRGEIWRAGKLPELPDWFKELDTTKSGQIAMYQWTKAGKPLDEFLAKDLNDDGLLTAEEAIRYERMKTLAANRPNGQASSIADRPASATGQGDRPKGKGKGGKKGG